jgi:hypothetical protein
MVLLVGESIVAMGIGCVIERWWESSERWEIDEGLVGN